MASNVLPQSSVIKLTEEDIPGATLNEPLESATLPSLRWWLLCHGIRVATSLKKDKVIEK